MLKLVRFRTQSPRAPFMAVFSLLCPSNSSLAFSKTNWENLLCSKFGSRFFRSISESEMKKGDWICRRCSLVNFARNGVCVRCEAMFSNQTRQTRVHMGPGDWVCPKFVNNANTTRCLRCP